MSKAKSKALKRKKFGGHEESKMFDALDKSLGNGYYHMAEARRRIKSPEC